jgi:hypothetical protein
VIIVFDQRDKHSDAGNALSRRDTELRQVPAQASIPIKHGGAVP